MRLALFADPMIHHRQKTVVSDLTFQTGMSSLMDFGTPDSTLDKGKTLNRHAKFSNGTISHKPL